MRVQQYCITHIIQIIATICVIQFAGVHLLSAGQYVHQTIGGPVRDVLNMEAPEILGNTELAALGLVDVTAAPFNADPTGKSDSTGVIQTKNSPCSAFAGFW